MWKQAKHVYVKQGNSPPDLSWKVNVSPKIYNKHKTNQAPVVQKGGYHYRLDSAISFPNTYPLDSDLSGW